MLAQSTSCKSHGDIETKKLNTLSYSQPGAPKYNDGTGYAA